jgi:heat shock protein HslJ
MSRWKFTTIRSLIILPIVLIVLIAGGKKAELENKVWVLESFVQGGEETEVLEGTEITLKFNSEKKRMSGKMGCNVYFGGYELNGYALSIPGPISVTRLTCGDQIDEQEKRFFQAIETAERYLVRDKNLRINSGSEVLIFRLKENCGCL